MKLSIITLRTRMLVFIHDLLMIPIAWLGAYWLRFNLSHIPEPMLKGAFILLPMVMIIQASLYWSFALYRGIWRFASLPDLIRIIKAVTAAVLLSVLILFFSRELIIVPRSIFPLYSVLLILFLGGSRLVYRWFKDYGELLIKKGQRVLIIGAGQSGEMIVRDLLRDNSKQYRPIVFVDDRPDKKGQDIHGIRVVGKCNEIPRIVHQYRIELIIIAMPSAPSANMRRIVEYCEQSGVAFRTLPGVTELASGSVKIDALRAVSLEDLLGRDPVTLDWANINQGIENKVILVTGGGGSIGSELCRQIAKIGPQKLVVIEQSEFNLYSLRLELSQNFPKINFIGYLADVTDYVAVKKIMHEHKFDIVFHAAAYKHVPMLETQLRIAMSNNILGTKTVAEVAVREHVKKFVLVSTDKAVNPTNIMGATKRAAEIFCQNYNTQSVTQFITVRFGNVLGSAGSVVPLFRKQIEQGGPVTVTHPDITRFFMTIPEAAQLILQATSMGEGGEIYVLDMGEPIKIRYLAEQMILLSGLKPNEDIEIKYTGLRPGEKLYEELFHETEELINTSHAKIMQSRFRGMDWQLLLSMLKAVESACEHYDEEKLLKLLCELVPEYKMEEFKALLQLVKI